MALVTKRTGGAEYGRWIKALIVGEPGAGKTLISSTFPEPYFASAEGGLMSIADRDIPFAEITATEEMFDLKKYLELEPTAREAMIGTSVNTVVVDTIDEIQRMYVRERTKGTKPMQLQDWGWLSEQMQTLIRGYRNLPMHVVFTCHIKETKDDELGRIVYKPGLQGAIADQIAGYVDLSLLLTSELSMVVEKTGTKRILKRELQTFPDDQHPWIKDRSGKLPQQFEVNFQDDFKRMNDLIFGGPALKATTVVSPTPVKVSTPDPKPVPETIQSDTTDEKDEGSTFTCDECATKFSDRDQAELSKIRLRKTLCTSCYKSARTK